VTGSAVVALAGVAALVIPAARRAARTGARTGAQTDETAAAASAKTGTQSRPEPTLEDAAH
ncbi:hypothetical protein AB0G81_19215, partial [Streptomyces asoensis]|uniref:hypothetical protein n=1 Tax=Streptomyces asoensis TaxID=249586 RepID=UPI00349452FB